MNNQASEHLDLPHERSLAQAILLRAASSLGMKVESSELDLETDSLSGDDCSLAELIIRASDQLGLSVAPLQSASYVDLSELLREGYPIILLDGERKCYLLRDLSGRRIEGNIFEVDRVSMVALWKSEVAKLLEQKSTTLLVVKSKLDCDTISNNPVNDRAHHHHHHMSPLTRFLGLLKMDRRDVRAIILFSLVSGILGLAAPLAVESLVNVVRWGVSLQPLLVLGLILLVFLSLSAALSVLQMIVVEMIQRRQFVRIVCDLSHRFPRANQQQLIGQYPRELANRLFDIITIQKATAEILVDGVSIVLMTFIGLVLLGFYHPFLLSFNLVLVLMMYFITVLLGRGAIRTSIEESRCKYSTFHWLQDVIQFPGAFRVNGGECLAIERASQLASDYVNARRSHFQILVRQLVFSSGLQAVALTALLGLGGWLVIAGELTLGQLVASELVVATVVGAFAKAGKSIEKFYDLMAGINKVGHLIDLATDLQEPIVIDQDGPLDVKCQGLRIQHGVQSFELDAFTVAAGKLQAIVTKEYTQPLALALAGLLDPDQGIFEVGGMDVRRLAMGNQQGAWVGLASRWEIFHGSIGHNLDLGRNRVGRSRMREILQQLNLWSDISHLPDGTATVLQTDGYPLSDTQKSKLMMARALAARPRLFIVAGLLDALPSNEQDQLLSFLSSLRQMATTIVITGDPTVAGRCDQQLILEA